MREKTSYKVSSETVPNTDPLVQCHIQNALFGRAKGSALEGNYRKSVKTMYFVTQSYKTGQDFIMGVVHNTIKEEVSAIGPVFDH